MMDFEKIAEETFFELSDLEWFETWYPEAQYLIFNWWVNPYGNSIEKFGCWDEYLDWCFFYGIEDPENPDGILFMDAGLSGIYLFG